MSRLEQIQNMLAADPQDAFLNFALAMEYVKSGQLEEAVAQFAKVSEVDPHNVASYFQRGNTLITLGRLHDASTVLREGIAVAERIGDHHAAGEMGEVLATLG